MSEEHNSDINPFEDVIRDLNFDNLPDIPEQRGELSEPVPVEFEEQPHTPEEHYDIEAKLKIVIDDAIRSVANKLESELEFGKDPFGFLNDTQRYIIDTASRVIDEFGNNSTNFTVTLGIIMMQNAVEAMNQSEDISQGIGIMDDTQLVSTYIPLHPDTYELIESFAEMKSPNRQPGQRQCMIRVDLLENELEPWSKEDNSIAEAYNVANRCLQRNITYLYVIDNFEPEGL